MKKHLIAAAVAGLIAAPAMAQVTVYGNVETGVLNTDTDGQSSKTELGSSQVNSSRLGFRGSEDLGGGLKAFFRLEAGVNLANGSMGKEVGEGDTYKKNASSFQFDRGAEVGLEGSFGSFKVGKFDITGTEGIDSTVSKIGNIGNYGLGSALDKDKVFDIDLGNDQDHSWQYSSPTIGGFKLQVGQSLKDGGSNTLSFYAGGKVAGVGLHIGQDTQKTGSVETTSTSMGADYDFGPIAVGLAYGLKQKDGDGDVTNVVVSGVVPLGGGLAVHGVYADVEKDSVVEGQKGKSGEKMAVALSKAFSNRTTGYLGYIATDNNGTETNQLYLAVNHRF
ncbi:MAG: hypothetical protein RLY30_1593 [Pseudomonadota bacterium]|jgi:predicted porin